MKIKKIMRLNRSNKFKGITLIFIVFCILCLYFVIMSQNILGIYDGIENEKLFELNSKKLPKIMTEIEKFDINEFGENNTPNYIPKILHQTGKNFEKLKKINTEFILECKQLNPKWKWIGWTDDKIIKFVGDNFPQYYNKFIEMEPFIKKVDAVRYLIMYYYGGLYLDVDVECLRNIDDFVEGLPLKFKVGWTGGYPEPFFLLSSPKNLFWIEAFESILKDWKKYNVRQTAGPQGLHRIMLNYAQKYGGDAIQKFVMFNKNETEIITPKFDVMYGVESWRWYIPDTFPMKDLVENKIGFIPNQIIDPTACLKNIQTCRYSHCHPRNDLGGALFVHHCHESWGGEQRKKYEKIKGFHF